MKCDDFPMLRSPALLVCLIRAAEHSSRHRSPEEATFHPAYRLYAKIKIRQMEKASDREFIHFNLGGNDSSLAQTGRGG